MELYPIKIEKIEKTAIIEMPCGFKQFEYHYEDFIDGFYIILAEIQFTKRKYCQGWALAGDDNLAALEEIAEKKGIAVGSFWRFYEPILNAIISKEQKNGI